MRRLGRDMRERRARDRRLGRDFAEENLTAGGRSGPIEGFGRSDMDREIIEGGDRRRMGADMAFDGRITPENYARRVFGPRTERF